MFRKSFQGCVFHVIFSAVTFTLDNSQSEGVVSLSGVVTERTLLRLTVSHEARECFTPAFPPQRQTRVWEWRAGTSSP